MKIIIRVTAALLIFSTCGWTQSPQERSFTQSVDAVQAAVKPPEELPEPCRYSTDSSRLARMAWNNTSARTTNARFRLCLPRPVDREYE